MITFKCDNFVRVATMFLGMESNFFVDNKKIVNGTRIEDSMSIPFLIVGARRPCMNCFLLF